MEEDQPQAGSTAVPQAWSDAAIKSSSQAPRDRDSGRAEMQGRASASPNCCACSAWAATTFFAFPFRNSVSNCLAARATREDSAPWIARAQFHRCSWASRQAASVLDRASTAHWPFRRGVRRPIDGREFEPALEGCGRTCACVEVGSRDRETSRCPDGLCRPALGRAFCKRALCRLNSWIGKHNEPPYGNKLDSIIPAEIGVLQCSTLQICSAKPRFR